MTALYIVLGTVAVVAFALWLAIRSAREQGGAEQRAGQSETVVEKVDDANKARQNVGAMSAAERREWLSKWARR